MLRHAAIPPDAPEADDIYGFAMGVDDTGAVSAFVKLGEEDAGIWRFPLAGGEGARVAMVPSDCLARDDVEGLAVVEGPPRRLVASVQGVNRAAVFRITETGLACEALVEVAAGAVDGVTETDGLDARSGPVGEAFPGGLLVMMDDQNAGFTTTFKLVDWSAVAAGLPD